MNSAGPKPGAAAPTSDVFANPHATATLPSGGFAPETREPLEFHRRLPGYDVTPLRSLPEVAEVLGCRTVLLKDESSRIDLPSFKILGASWAVITCVAEQWLDDAAFTDPLTDTARRLAALDRPLRLAAATDGNHGRGVARMAALLGVGCDILVPAGTAQARIDAIAGEGARVEVVDGTYDDAVAASATLAGADTLVVSDTSWPGYERAPRAVIEGYSTMFHEIDDELAAQGLPAPTLVAVQAGVGAFAAAALRHYRADASRADSGSPVRTVVVEPSSANCLMASARHGTLTEVPGPHHSHMAGLNCGLPSVLAWPLVLAGTDTFVAIDDETAYAAMRLLASVGVASGESGAAALGGVLALAAQEPAARAAGLDPDACVLIVNTEGVTDPVNYEAVMAGAGTGAR